MLNRIVPTLILSLFTSATLVAADANDSSYGYIFAAPGGIKGESLMTMHLGGGGEAYVYKGFAVGAELGYLAPIRYLGDGIGILSANGSHHFRNLTRSGRFVPFLSLGYSLGFRSGTVSGVNFGAGTNYWITDRQGLRLEFRDHALHFGRVFEHLYGFRIGWTFR